MALFNYNKQIHTRRSNPGPFIRYQAYKKYLKIEFDKKCIYCLVPVGLKGDENFAVEHYWPKSFFPELELVYNNLFYACSICNSYKGSYFPRSEKEKSQRFIPNPCEHVMYQHLQFDSDLTVKSKSSAGKFAVDLLELNNPIFVNYRLTVKMAVKGYNSEIATCSENIKKLEKKIASSLDTDEISLLTANLDRQKSNLEEMIRLVADITI